MMKKAILTSLVLGVGAALVGTAGPAAAKPAPYDGTWNVRFLTESGVCDRSYDYTVAIQSGSVRPISGNAPVSISGGVTRDGRVALDIRHSLATADAAGRLQAKAGAGTGTWRVAALGCTGRWTAQRRVT